jgi:hypothetical protein
MHCSLAYDVKVNLTIIAIMLHALHTALEINPTKKAL